MSLIVDRRTAPEGVVPPHLQQWVLICIVVVMVGILTFTTPPAKPRAATAGGPSVAVVDANQQRIEEYQRRVQEQAQRLAAEQAELALAKQALAAQPGAEAWVASPTRGSGRERGPQEDVQGSQVHGNSLDSRGHGAGASVADSVAFSRSATTAVTRERPEEGRAPDAPKSGASQEMRYRLMEGTFIETVLTNRLDGTFPGPVNCLVTTPVYASDMRHVLIPAGSRALGEARAVNTFGQSRLAVVFHRLVLPNGSRVDLNNFHGLNQIGDLGLKDQVDRHYAQIFGASLAVGAIAGLAHARTGGIDATSLDVYRQGAAANLAQSSAHILDRFLNILPEVTIREGHRIKVYLAGDLELPEYRETRPLSGGRP